MRFRSRLAESQPRVTKLRDVDGWAAFSVAGDVDSSIEDAHHWVSGHGQIWKEGFRLVVEIEDVGARSVGSACRAYGIPTVSGTKKASELLNGLTFSKHGRGTVGRVSGAGAPLGATWIVKSEVPGLDLQSAYHEMRPKLNHLAQALADWVEANAAADYT